MFIQIILFNQHNLFIRDLIIFNNYLNPNPLRIQTFLIAQQNLFFRELVILNDYLNPNSHLTQLSLINEQDLFVIDLLTLSDDLNFNPPLTLPETLTFPINDISSEEIHKPLLFKTRILTVFFTVLVEQSRLFTEDLLILNNNLNSNPDGSAEILNDQ